MVRRATFVLGCCVFLLHPSLAAQQTTYDLVRSFMDAWSDHDVDRIGSLCSAGAEYTEVATASVFHGSEGCAQYASETFAGSADFALEIREIIVEGDRAAVTWVMSGTQTGDWTGLPATGGKFSIPGVSVIETEGNRIHRVADYWDLYTLLGQLGVLPEPSSGDSSG